MCVSYSRVSAWNKIGPSTPSSHSDVCTTQPDVPYKNPDNVVGEGSDPTNMVISWSVSKHTYSNKLRLHLSITLKPNEIRPLNISIKVYFKLIPCFLLENASNRAQWSRLLLLSDLAPQHHRPTLGRGTSARLATNSIHRTQYTHLRTLQSQGNNIIDTCSFYF